MSRAFKAVIFDMDGTLVDSERLLMDTWRFTAEKHGFDYGHFIEVLKTCIGLRNDASMKIITDEYGPDFDFKGYNEETLAIFLQRILDGEAAVKPGAFHILDGLKARGIRLGLGTSTRSVRTAPRVRVSGMDGYFDAVVCGDMVERSKPAPDIFLRTAEELGVTPSDCVVIEDSNAGVKAAVSAGMRVIMVPDVLEPDSASLESAEKVFTDLFEAAEYLFAELEQA